MAPREGDEAEGELAEAKAAATSLIVEKQGVIAEHQKKKVEEF